MVVNEDSKMGPGIIESMGVLNACVEHFDQMGNFKMYPRVLLPTCSHTDKLVVINICKLS